jgi:ParB family chromosome partitioning protein
VEEAVRTRNELGGTATASSRQSKLRPPGIDELEDLLSSHLDTRVRVDMGPRIGKVVIDFADLDDLERIYRAMTDRQEA